MTKIEYRGVKEIHDKYEAIILNLRQQFAKFNDEREKRENKVKKEADDPVNEFLPISVHIRNYLEWDTNALLIEEQTIGQFESYLKDLYKYLKEVKSQQERLAELTEELDRKEEDLEMMGELVKEKNETIKDREMEVNRLITEKEKMINSIRKAKSVSSPNNILKPTERVIQSIVVPEMDNEREELFNDIVTEKPKKQLQSRRICEKCGKDISFRRTDARYCVECAYVNKKEKDKLRFKKKDSIYDKRGDIVETEETETEEGEEDTSSILMDTQEEDQDLEGVGEDTENDSNEDEKNSEDDQK